MKTKKKHFVTPEENFLRRYEIASEDREICRKYPKRWALSGRPLQRLADPSDYWFSLRYWEVLNQEFLFVDEDGTLGHELVGADFNTELLEKFGDESDLSLDLHEIRDFSVRTAISELRSAIAKEVF